MCENPVFSIIIPHKNIPGLLQRCIDSIPKRSDLEVIIVDDNSDPSIVNFSAFPGMDRPFTEILFTKENRGAGYARNIGITRAKGRWLLFADADDFYNYCLSSFLDEHIHDPHDLIFYRANCIDSDSYISSSRKDQLELNAYINAYRRQHAKKPENRLRYASSVPWAKLINKKLVDDHNIKFDETQKSNDVTFSYLAGYYAKSIEVDNRAVYCVTRRDNSIGYGPLSVEKKLDYIYVTGKERLFFRQHNIAPVGNSAGRMLLNLYAANSAAFVDGKKILSNLGFSKQDISNMLIAAFFFTILFYAKKIVFFLPKRIVRRFYL
jgi:glycosyltransferase involved in cell wall biosynthesis